MSCYDIVEARRNGSVMKVFLTGKKQAALKNCRKKISTDCSFFPGSYIFLYLMI